MAYKLRLIMVMLMLLIVIIIISNTHCSEFLHILTHSVSQLPYEPDIDEQSEVGVQINNLPKVTALLNARTAVWLQPCTAICSQAHGLLGLMGLHWCL